MRQRSGPGANPPSGLDPIGRHSPAGAVPLRQKSAQCRSEYQKSGTVTAPTSYIKRIFPGNKSPDLAVAVPFGSQNSSATSNRGCSLLQEGCSSKYCWAAARIRTCLRWSTNLALAEALILTGFHRQSQYAVPDPDQVDLPIRQQYPDDNNNLEPWRRRYSAARGLTPAAHLLAPSCRSQLFQKVLRWMDRVRIGAAVDRVELRDSPYAFQTDTEDSARHLNHIPVLAHLGQNGGSSNGGRMVVPLTIVSLGTVILLL